MMEYTDRLTKGNLEAALERKPYVAGSYTGKGTYGAGDNATHVEPGFTPSFIAIAGSPSGTAACGAYFVYPSTTGMCGKDPVTVAWTDTGLKITSTSETMQLNKSGAKYYYIAFR